MMTLEQELEMESAATEFAQELETAALEFGGRCPPDQPYVVRGFRRYSNVVTLLPRAEQDKANNIAREIVQASTGTAPIAQVRLLGHADYDPARERSQPGFMRQISRQRAETLASYLRNRVGARIASAISWNYDGAGADRLAVPGPQSESERECNRRVEVQLVRRSVPPPSPPPSTVRTIKITVKSFIARIGSRHGTATCFLPLPLPPPAPPIPIGADVRLRALSAATDAAYSENPLTDRPDKLYRLFSECTFRVVCTPGRPPVVTASALATDVGLECIPRVGACLVPPPITVVLPVSIRILGPNTFQFVWAVKGRPNLAAEPAFQAVCPRTSVFIWHRIVGTVVCDVAGLRLASFSLTGSRFPSHRLFVNGAICTGCTVPQNEFRNLWIRDASDPTLVSG